MQPEFLEKEWDAFVEAGIQLSDYSPIFRVLQNIHFPLFKENHIALIAKIAKRCLKVAPQSVISFATRVVDSANKKTENTLLLTKLIVDQ